MKHSARNFVLMIVFGFGASVASAQVPTGTPPFGSFGGGPDVINLANLNSHLAIPILHKPGRGTDFTYDLSYDSSVWYPITSGSTKTWQPVGNWGWRGQTEILTGYVSNTMTTNTQNIFCTVITYSNWVYHDAFGVSHPFNGSSGRVSGSIQHCGTGNTWTLTAVAQDGSGYTINGNQFGRGSVTSSRGTAINAPINGNTGAATFTDRNGNQIDLPEFLYQVQ